ncbi:hypothetical protein LEP1GSC036_2520 [Leptospira weilii str. 2006001853]|uniref:Uncharacterized protein n=3 Tax=Leptospira weilii TaxID=28184 RepID=A0A828YVT2_9LEPT|nr:hypothetical protein LEP1GSC036_2520 [Leptospira weilii str. 2006001853]EMJ66289.1 hypothetical protein LEP1GSC051_3572 [Leptospira sp. P2653]EMM70406.1 hypothetical protein LEP1GSC038_1772 [Leptospira weilii str. 2006001855]EMN42767.1 hypothetical protein LEP1GSC086_1154 [Leptospira weilii str. LNT 1234]EMN91358.1 hypothetical protein LEP1GSC108_3220 [Leptospira weilii str. UI 13098]OMI17029.1 hypothetical protein BUQ74_12515 [Leptospira weilii serovar Heyan]QDK23070.1 hypothetical protei
MLFEHKNFLILSSRKDTLVYKNRFEIGRNWFSKAECEPIYLRFYIPIGIFKSSVVGFVIL